jgi:DNA-binding beta-propeller fold protein YncE
VYRGIGRDKGNLWVAIRDFGESLTRGDTWETWWRFFRDREHPQGLDSVYSAAVWSTAYFPLMYDPATGPDVEGRLTIGRSGDAPGAFSDPSGLAVDGEGSLYVLDSGNGRIQKFSSEGRFVKATGTTGSGGGEFNQPADLALDAQGNLYVVDTWNHRVQKFDAELNFIATWGKPTRNLLTPGDHEMWGPRSAATDRQGNVFLVDTGTHRVRKFSPDGKLLGTVGGWGTGLGQFREPVGITFDASLTSILVADAGNARIQRLSTELRPIIAYAVKEWEDLDPANKPDLAALPDGRILASDPAHGRILLMDDAAQVIAALDSVGGTPLALPRGVAYDAERQFVFVSEGAANQVRRFPLSDFAFR